MSEKIYGFKENGTKIEVPAKEDIDNMIIIDSSGVVNAAEKIEKLLSAIDEEYKLIKPLYFNQYYYTGSSINGNSNSNMLIPCINVVANEEKNTLTFVFDGGDRGGEKVYAGNYVLTLDTHQYVSMNITSVNRYVDSLDSNSTTKALTANQGMVLDKRLSTLEAEQKLLWRDPAGSYMMESQQAPLSETISSQKNGIVLVFQPYVDNEPKSWGLYSYFFPKYLISLLGEGYGYCINIPENEVGLKATKYIYFYDDHLAGNAANVETLTIFGSSINNKDAVLTAVIGI